MSGAGSCRIVFAGTPEFACPALAALIEAGHRPCAVLTQPDRPAGRGRKLTASPVKALALAHGLDVLQPESLKPPESRAAVAALAPDLLITAAYGLILPPGVLAVPRHGCWNLHASLLPRWRGASPIQQTILAGDAETGISLMRMAAGLDTGPVILARAVFIDPEESAGELHDRLAPLAARVLLEGLTALLQGRLPPAVPQDDAAATYAPRLRREDAALDWRCPAAELARRVRAYNPWPVAFAEIRGEHVRIFRARALAGNGRPGEVLDAGAGGLRVACGSGVLAIDELQSPGKRRMPVRDWLNARPDWR